jgi:hypothetical protein
VLRLTRKSFDKTLSSAALATDQWYLQPADTTAVHRKTHSSAQLDTEPTELLWVTMRGKALLRQHADP